MCRLHHLHEHHQITNYPDITLLPRNVVFSVNSRLLLTAMIPPPSTMVPQELQAFLPIHFAYAHVTQTQTTFQTVVSQLRHVSVVAVGQRNGIIPSTLRTRLDRGWLKSSHYFQQLSKMCMWPYRVAS